MKIDIHTHILPKNWPNLKEKYGYGGFVQLEHYKPRCARMMIDDEVFREVQDSLWDPDVRIKDCHHHKIDMQVLSTVPVMFNYWAKPEHTLDLCKILNDHIAGVVNDYPGRFRGLGTLPMQSMKLSIKELERCINDLGLAGVEIGTHIHGKNLDDESLFEVFQAAEELGAAVFIHPWDMLGKERMSKYWTPWLVGMPAESALAICSMIFGGVFERLKKLRVCFAHGGGSFPFTIGRIEHGFNVRPDLVAIKNKIKPRKYLGKFYLDSLVHDQNALKFLIELIGEDKVVMGSDYPFPLGENEPGKLIASLTGISKDAKEKLLWKNAEEFLGINSYNLSKNQKPKKLSKKK